MAARQTEGAAKRKAAQAEAKDEPQTIEFREVEITVPAKLPATVEYDIAILETKEDAGESNFGAVYKLIESLIGAEQIVRVRDKIAADGSSIDEGGGWMADLLGDVLQAAGTNSGESPASDES